MSENVVSLHGTFQHPDAQANDTLISELERLLEAARAGEIIGMAGSYIHHNKAVTYSYAGVVASYAMIGSLECMKERLVQLALAQD